MVDPDQRRLAAVYHRKTEADDLRWVRSLTLSRVIPLDWGGYARKLS
jgi:hypothetical protein